MGIGASQRFRQHFPAVAAGWGLPRQPGWLARRLVFPVLLLGAGGAQAVDAVAIKGSQIVEIGHNTRGGQRELTRAAGQFLIGAMVDFDALWGVQGTGQVTITNRHGNSLTNDAGLDTLQPAHSVYGRGEIWRLTQLWYEHHWGATALKLGRMPMGDDFASTVCNFTNLTLCGPAPSQIVSGYLYNVPVSAWGARLRQKLGSQLHLNLGVYESNPLNLDEDRGFYLGFGGATGTFYAVELQWAPDHAGMDSTWKLGAWYDGSNSSDVILDVNHQLQARTGAPFLRRDHHHGWHANLHHQFLRAREDGSGGLWLVGNFAFSDQATNRLRSKLALGLTYTGPFASRPKDDISFGIGRTETNDRVTAADQALIAAGLRDIGPQRDEYVAEFYYSWRPRGDAVIRPYTQYIHDPGGQSARNAIVVVGLKLVVPFALK